MRVVVIGEILWDVFPDSERVGGASFNFAANARRLGHEVLFVSGVGVDDRGRKALLRIEDLGLSARFVRQAENDSTGMVTVSLDPSGQPDYVLHRPAAYDAVDLSAQDLAQLAEFRPDWIYFGTLHQMDPRARSATRRLLEALPRARRFYDVNLRKDSYTDDLVVGLLGRASVVKLNHDEMGVVGKFLGWVDCMPDEFCRRMAERFRLEVVCVTRGAFGCVIFQNGEYVEAPAPRVQVVDTVGAGDAFAAALLHGLEFGWTLDKIADFANRIGALVASRAGALPEWTLNEL